MSNDWIPTAYRKPYGHEYYHRSPWDDIVFNKLLIAYGPNYIKHCIGFYDGENWFDQDNRLIKCVQAWMPFDGYVPVMKEKDERNLFACDFCPRRDSCLSAYGGACAKEN